MLTRVHAYYALADFFAVFALGSPLELSVCSEPAKTSRGKLLPFPFDKPDLPASPPYNGHLDSKLNYPRKQALYQVSVRLVKLLPTAAFRFLLTVDTLVFGYRIPVSRLRQDLHLLGQKHARHT